MVLNTKILSILWNYLKFFIIELFLISRPFKKIKEKTFCGRTCHYGGITLINCFKTVDPILEILVDFLS